MALAIAIQDPRYLSKCHLMPSGQSVTKAEAAQLGYTVAKSAAHAASIRNYAGDAAAEGRTYLDAILALPAAKERPLSAAKIASAHSFKSLPLARASLLLAGLPLELSETAVPVPVAISPIADAKLRRTAEIMTIGLGIRADRGDAEAKRQLVGVNYALRIAASSTQSFTASLRQAGVDPSTIKVGK